MRRWVSNTALWMLLCAAIFGSADSAQAQLGSRLFGGRSQTLGGRYLWTDLVVYDDWRVQHNAFIGSYRLLDPNDRQTVAGTLEHCLQQFDATKRDLKLPPLPEEVVVVLHGLGANRHFMQGFADFLKDEGGLSVVNVGYASTMGSIEEHAQALDSVIRHLDGVKRVSFAAHSMGNIVIRRFLYDVAHLAPDMRPPVTFQRMVMISPPNHGAELADSWGDNKLVQMAAGKPLEELAPAKGWPQLELRLATPDFPFGIIAGGRGNESGFLPGVPGDDDGLLSITTQKLAGASDFIQTGGIHQMMPRFEEVRESSLRFLLHGYFDTEGTRQPL